MSKGEDDFRTHLDRIESAYEFMLAYAAQGRETDAGPSSGPSIRNTLEELNASLGAVAGCLAGEVDDEAVRSLADTIDEDARRASISITAALSCSRISSQLVDNLNASIHLRAVLTGLFLADEIFDIKSVP